MQTSKLRDLVRRDPWPWLIAILTITLFSMWLREKNLINQEIEEISFAAASGEKNALYNLQRNNPRQLYLEVMGKPTFHDPFGNLFYFIPTEWNPTVPVASRNPDPHFMIETFNLDGSHCRTILLGGKTKYRIAADIVSTGDLPPLFAFSLLFLLFYGWLRNTRQRQNRA